MEQPASGEGRPLLRTEVLKQRLPARFGPVTISQPVRLRLYVLVCLLFCVALALFLYRAPFKAAVRVSGVLLPETPSVSVRPMMDGSYVRIPVSEGDAVRRGEIIALVSRERFDERGREFSREERSFTESRRHAIALEAEMARRRASAELHRIAASESSLKTELQLLREELDVNRERADIANASLAALRELLERSAVSESDYREQRAVSLLLEQESVQIRQRIAAREGELLDLEHARSLVEQERQKAEQERNLSGARLSHEQAASAVETLTALTASRDGVIGPVNAAVGDRAHAGQVLTRINPDDAPLEAHLYLPSSSVGRIQAGQEVLVTYDAYPYQRHGNHRAEVVSISASTIDPREVQLPLPHLREPVYRVRAQLPAQSLARNRNQDQDRPLRAGMTLQADIVTAEMRLLEHILQPLLRLIHK